MARSRILDRSVDFLHRSQPEVRHVHILASGKYVLLTPADSNLRSFSRSVPFASLCHSSADHDMEGDEHQGRVHSVCDERRSPLLL